MNLTKCDPRALRLAQELQKAEQPEAAILFGSRTSGEIENNHLVPLPDGSRVLISSTSYRTSTGLDVGLRGLEPNLAVRYDWDAVTEQADPVREASQAALLRVGG